MVSYVLTSSASYLILVFLVFLIASGTKSRMLRHCFLDFSLLSKRKINDVVLRTEAPYFHYLKTIKKVSPLLFVAWFLVLRPHIMFSLPFHYCVFVSLCVSLIVPYMFLLCRETSTLVPILFLHASFLFVCALYY